MVSYKKKYQEMKDKVEDLKSEIFELNLDKDVIISNLYHEGYITKFYPVPFHEAYKEDWDIYLRIDNTNIKRDKRVIFNNKEGCTYIPLKKKGKTWIHRHPYLLFEYETRNCKQKVKITEDSYMCKKQKLFRATREDNIDFAERFMDE